MGITCCQLLPSANAPWTSTIAGLGVWAGRPQARPARIEAATDERTSEVRDSIGVLLRIEWTKRWAARLSGAPPDTHYFSARVLERRGRNAARSSAENSSGCSHAAKCPPCPTSLK